MKICVEINENPANDCIITNLLKIWWIITRLNKRKFFLKSIDFYQNILKPKKIGVLMVKAKVFLLSKVDNFGKLLAQYKYKYKNTIRQSKNRPTECEQSVFSRADCWWLEPIVIHIYFYGQTRDILWHQFKSSNLNKYGFWAFLRIVSKPPTNHSSIHILHTRTHSGYWFFSFAFFLRSFGLLFVSLILFLLALDQYR